MVEGYSIIDAHAHIFQDKIAEKATTGISKFYGLPMYHQTGSVKELLQSGKEDGVDGFLVCSVATKAEQVASINQFLSKTCAEHSNCIAFGALFPTSDTVEQDLETIQKDHMHGIKLHPDFQNFDIDDPAIYPVYDMIQSTGLPILMHMGDPRTTRSHPRRLANVLKEFPHLRVIAAHLGGYERWDAALEYLQPSDRLRFDTSSSSAFLPPEKFMEHFRRFGTDHYFFGVDFPMWSHKNEIHFIMNLNLSSLKKKAIFSENFKNWLGL